jgi:hypothetical protein
MATRPSKTSPLIDARLAGILCLFVIPLGISGGNVLLTPLDEMQGN